MKIFAKTKTANEEWDEAMSSKRKEYQEKFGKKQEDIFEPEKPVNKTRRTYTRNVFLLGVLGGLALGYGCSNRIAAGFGYIKSATAAEAANTIEGKTQETETPDNSIEQKVEVKNALDKVSELKAKPALESPVEVDDMKKAYEKMGVDEKKELIKYILSSK